MAMQETLQKVREAGPRSTAFLNEVYSEVSKVHWPARKETYASTVVVLIVMGLFAGFLGLVDFIISRLVQSLLS